jgi:hypothetical protein
MRQALGSLAIQLGYRATQWVRVAQTDDWMRFIRPEGPESTLIRPPAFGTTRQVFTASWAAADNHQRTRRRAASVAC